MTILVQRKLSALLVGEPQRAFLEGDFALKLESSLATVAPAEVLEFPFGGGEVFRCALALPVELFLSPS